MDLSKVAIPPFDLPGLVLSLTFEGVQLGNGINEKSFIEITYCVPVFIIGVIIYVESYLSTLRRVGL